MKKNIHPQVYTNTTVTCACGNSFTTISTLKDIKVEICSNCHPFFTGTQKFIDTEGRIDKFAKKVQKAQELKQIKKNKKSPKKDTIKEKTSLKDMLKEARTPA